MNNLFLSRLLVFVFTVLTITGIECAFANEDITPEQMVLLMKASREQYVTINAKMKANSYENISEGAEPKLKSTREIISRWTKYKSFSKTIQTEYLDTIPHEGYTPTATKTYAITSEWSKRLTEAPDGRTPRGYVRPGRSLEADQPFYNIYTAMWDLCGWPWEKINFDETTITRNEVNNYYIVKAKMGESSKGPFVRLFIDPSKNFIPVKKEFLKYDGTLLLRYECSSFHQDKNGLWIPYQYSWSDPRVSFSTVYDVEEVVVNEPIPDKLLNFSFPSGTVVNDEIANLQYKIDEMIETQIALDVLVEGVRTTGVKDNFNSDITANSEQKHLLKSEDIVVTSPANEKDLLATASKAKELLQIPPKQEKKSLNIYFVSFFTLLIIIIVSLVGIVRNKKSMTSN